MHKKNVAVIYGGVSSEHSISLRSAATIISNIPKDKYNIFPIGITKSGKWFYYKGSVSKISNEKWEKDLVNCEPVFLSTTADIKGFLMANDNRNEILKIDVAIPVLHGKNGEDGSIQGLFKLAQIPLVGCDILSSAVCMDKIISNIMFRYIGLDQAKFIWFYHEDFFNNSNYYYEIIEKEIGNYPVFVKPANAGSSIGISKVYSKNEIHQAVVKASCEDRKILIEESIEGRELECAIIGNEFPRASIIGEIKSKDDFYDYNAKYVNNNSKLIIPANIQNSISNDIQKKAITAYKTMNCSGLARIDFFLENNTNRILINEINTFPGFTNISMYPMLMNSSGTQINDLLNELILLAIKKN